MNARTGMIAAVSSVSVTLAGVNEILTCVSLLFGVAIAGVSLFRLIKNKNQK